MALFRDDGSRIDVYADGTPIVSPGDGDMVSRSLENDRARTELRRVFDGSEPAYHQGAHGPETDATAELIRQLHAAGPSVHGSAQSSRERRNLYHGRSVTLTALGGNIDPPRTSAVWIPLQEDAEVYTITIQASPFPNLAYYPGVGNGQLYAYIQWMIGEAVFNKRVLITGSTVRRIPIQARKIMIDVSWENVDYTGGFVVPSSVTFNVGIQRGYLPGAEVYSPAWVNNPQEGPAGGLTLKEIYQAWTGPGILCSLTGTLLSLDGGAHSPLYPAFFDLAAIGTRGSLNGTAPLFYGPPLVAGQPFSFDDEFSPQRVFGFGICAALSTTPNVYTAPSGAAATWRVDVKVGQ